jgi:hypothetical protein
MTQAAQNMDVLSSPDNIKILANVLKTNVAACTSIGSFYLPQLGRIFLDMLGLYKAVSGIVSDTIQKEGLFFLLVLYINKLFIQSFITIRSYCNENTKSSAITNGEKGGVEAHGNLCQESGRLGRCECELYAAFAGRYSRGL